jgi:hypothetical protein
MPRSSSSIEVYLEAGAKRTFAGALDWPGWCRSARDEAGALEALVAYGPRYERALAGSGLRFRPPRDASQLSVVERLAGGSATDFGVPDEAPSADTAPVSARDLERFGALLAAIWRAFDRAAEEASGRELRKGPRGGGRDLDRIVAHVAAADYLDVLGWKRPPGGTSAGDLARRRAVIIEGLAASARGDIPSRGPRGGVRWSPRYFVRRLAWHTLDHAWEIEDRLM